jgi:phage shock protein A
MGLFSRFTDIINANLNTMLDKVEQPEKMIRLIISEMEETLREVRSSAAKHIAEQKNLSA